MLRALMSARTSLPAATDTSPSTSISPLRRPWMRSEPVEFSVPSIRAPCPTTDTSSLCWSATFLLAPDGPFGGAYDSRSTRCPGGVRRTSLVVDAAQPLRLCAAFLRGDPALDRLLARLRGTASARRWRDRPANEPVAEPFQRSRPLHGPERRRRPEIQAQLYPRVSGVDRLTAGPGGSAEAPAQFLLGNHDRSRYAERAHHGGQYGGGLRGSVR